MSERVSLIGRQRAAGREIRIAKGSVVRFFLSYPCRAKAFESLMTHIYLISGKRKLYLTPARKLEEKYVHLSRRHGASWCVLCSYVFE